MQRGQHHSVESRLKISATKTTKPSRVEQLRAAMRSAAAAKEQAARS